MKNTQKLHQGVRAIVKASANGEAFPYDACDEFCDAITAAVKQFNIKFEQYKNDRGNG